MTDPTFETHEVFNQPPAYAGRNLFETDPVLRTVLDSFMDPDTEADLERLGGYCGSHEAADMARLANEERPRLKTHDAQGRRLDLVDFHPAYHAFMRRSVEAGLSASVWERDEAEQGRRFLLRAARLFLLSQAESGHLASLSMTNAALAVLIGSGGPAEQWARKAIGRRYDHRFQSAGRKIGLTIGIATSEKQAGSELAGIATRAEPGDGGLYRIVGHKWFLGAPMSDAFLVLAQAPGGLSAFLVPRFRDDGTVNAIRLQRLKDTLGNRSGAIAEAEFTGAEAWLIGRQGAGTAMLDEPTRLCRLDAAIVSAGLMRSALGRAVHHVRHRQVGGAALIGEPLMSRVLADMAFDVAAVTALCLRLARAFDARATNARDAAVARLVTPAALYWIGKGAPMLVAEAMECLGGNGYVEDSELARVARDVPAAVMAGGPGNVLCLDILKTINDEPDLLDAVLADIRSDLGEHSLVSVDVLKAAAKACRDDIGSARILTEQLALTAAAAALRRFLPRPIGDGFLYTRLGGQWRATYGMLDGRFEASGLVDYMFPPVGDPRRLG